MNDQAGRPGPSPAVRIGYAALGLIAGGLWLLGSGDPLWLHALRVLAIVLVVPAVASRLAAAAARRRGQQQTETLSVGRLVAIKAGLVIVAIAVTGLLGSRVAHLDLYLAAWLALMVAVGGPVIHHRLLVEVTGGQRPHRRRPRRRRCLLLTAGLAACAVLAGAADIVVGHVISGRISATASKRLTGPVSVSIGATPALYDAVTGRIPAVTIHAPSTAVCNLRDVDVRATLTDVRRSNSRVTTQGVSADMVVTARTLAGLISSDFGTPTVTPDPSAGVLRIGIGPGGLLQIEEKAQLHGDTIQLSPAGMSLHGQPVPDSLKGTIASHLTISRTLSGLPLNLTPRSLAITGTGLQVRFAAGPATLTGTRSAPACATR
jgi:LmeA-like phospholipid-binding